MSDVGGRRAEGGDAGAQERGQSLDRHDGDGEADECGEEDEGEG